MLKNIFGSLLISVGLVSNSAEAEDFATTECAKYGQPEFIFSSVGRKLIPSDVNAFKLILEGMVASGSRFKDGETLLVGSMILKIEATKDGKLRLLEPDMKGMPIKFVDSVATTIILMRRQRDAVLSLDPSAIPKYASIVEPLLVAPNALKAEIIVMQRVTDKSAGSGWIITDAKTKTSANQTKFEAMSIYEAMLKRSDITDFLAFPSDYQVQLKSRREFALFRESVPIEPIKNSYLFLLNSLKQ